MTPSRLWRLSDVSVSGGGPTSRLRNINLTIQSGVTAVIGPSGAGKTTLLNLLVQFERPSSGSIEFRSKRDTLPLYWAPQTAGLWPHATPLEHLAWVSPHPSDSEDLQSLLDRFGISSRANAKSTTLSEGESARLAVARALASKASVLVMDEPLVNVEPSRLPIYWEIVHDHCQRYHASLVFSSHSAEAVLREADQVICLAHGELVYTGDVTSLYYRPSSREQADFLGPNNWFDDPAELSDWFDPVRVTCKCLRPEQISIHPNDESCLSVRQITFAGAYEELQVMNEMTGRQRRFFHRPSAQRLRPGDRVGLRTIE